MQVTKRDAIALHMELKHTCLDVGTNADHVLGIGEVSLNGKESSFRLLQRVSEATFLV